MVTKQVIDQFISLWQCKQFAMFVRPPTSVTSGPTTTAASTNHAELQNRNFESNFNEDQTKKTKLIDTNYMFSLILSPLNIFTQQNKSAASFDKLAQLMFELIKNRLMSISFVNEQSLKLLHMEWEQVFSISLIEYWMKKPTDTHKSIWAKRKVFNMIFCIPFIHRPHWKSSQRRSEV